MNTFNKYEISNKLSTLIFNLAILFFIIGFGFTDTPTPFGWYQQFMPNLNNQPLQDITFTDSLNGYAITRINTISDSGYILRTIDGGNNWIVTNKIDSTQLQRVEFVNSSTGFICGSTIFGGYLIKTTNGGTNWYPINVSFSAPIHDMYVLNIDTIWITDYSIYGQIYRTTDGGLSWYSQFSILEHSIDKLYMYNRNLGFACTTNQLFKTTNSGQNWNQIGGSSQSNAFFDMYFVDSLIGWKTKDTVKKTTDGGFNWQNEQIPRGPNISFGIYSISVVNRDTIWGTGGVIEYPNLQDRGIIYRTTDGGDNWLFQVPDTSFDIHSFKKIQFINKLLGWSYGTSSGVHTISGGDSNFVNEIKKIDNDIPSQFILYQNYPNPFNPRTIIPYSLKSPGYVKLVAYDILGKEVQRLVDQNHRAHQYTLSLGRNHDLRS